MIGTIQRWLIAWRFRNLTRHFDRQIADARKAHRPVRHIQAARQAFVHDALRGAR